MAFIVLGLTGLENTRHVAPRHGRSCSARETWDSSVGIEASHDRWTRTAALAVAAGLLAAATTGCGTSTTRPETPGLAPPSAEQRAMEQEMRDRFWALRAGAAGEDAGVLAARFEERTDGVDPLALLRSSPDLIWFDALDEPDPARVQEWVDLARAVEGLQASLDENLRRVGGTVLTAASRSDVTLSLAHELGANAIVPSEEDANEIYVGPDMILLAQTDDQLACVIGHELAHIEAGHAEADARMQWWRDLTRKIFAYGDPIGFAIWGEDAPPAEAVTVVLADVPRRLSGWDREQEWEADELGLGYSSRAGFAPTACAEMARQMQRWREATGGGSNRGWFRVHPSTEDRIAALERIARSP